MQKRKKGALFLILGVLFVSLYQILPTLLYYQKPLKKPLEASYAPKLVSNIEKRIEKQEKETLAWVQSYCSLLKLSPLSISYDPDTSQLIHIVFPEEKQAKKLKKYFPLAARNIEESYKALSLKESSDSTKKVTIQRAFTSPLSSEDWKQEFSFFSKRENASYSPFYKNFLIKRASIIAKALSGDLPKETTRRKTTKEELAHTLVQASTLFKESPSLAKRFFASFPSFYSIDIAFLEESFLQEKETVQKEKRTLQKQPSLSEAEKERLLFLENQELLFIKASSLLKNQKSLFTKASPTSWEEIEKTWLKEKEQGQTLLLNTSSNPFLESLQIDWEKEILFIPISKDFLEFQKNQPDSTSKSRCEQFLIDEIARISSLSKENMQKKGDRIEIPLGFSSSPSSFLALDLEKLALSELSQVKTYLQKNWNPSHPDLKRENFPIVSEKEYEALPELDKNFCLLLCRGTDPSLKKNSLYLVAKGIERISEKYEGGRSSHSASLFFDDFSSLNSCLKELGFRSYPGAFLGNSPFVKDFLFEKENFYDGFLQATKEPFFILGDHTLALLPLSNLEERIRIENQIETKEQEALLKAKEDYYQAQMSSDPQIRFGFPKPYKSVFWNNLLLNVKKYFQGAEEKVLHWGLDLSGGKTVTLALLDSEKKLVTGEKELLQGMNELYQRVNKLGVSEVSIQREGDHLVLDFPGSQSIPASQLLQASSMYFHVVQEKFSIHNPSLAPYVNVFLEQVWNEAVVSNLKDPGSLQKIAYKHLYGSFSKENPAPRTEAARILYEKGLRLANPFEEVPSKRMDTTLCKIAVFREEGKKGWQGQNHPLLFVFHNHALEGKDLQNIKASYDPSQGNFLSFEIQNTNTEENPRETFYNWTLPFSKESLYRSENDFLQGRGWRMAVILNDTIVCAPTLNQPLKDSAMISGSFTQREVQKLMADLKAGSLTYFPEILSEKNISPELGAKEKSMGLLATFLGLVFVLVAMTTYYRFCGWIACLAVLFNLLIMAAAFQYLQVTLTLASLAGVILTVGMAVDANVLVFERMKEEMILGKTVYQAIYTGYKKAFSAILDSNLTTILAAFILLSFDSGPIKGFAVTLTLGIISSLFTALFVTRSFFEYWSQKKERTSLNMKNWIGTPKINFLQKAPYILGASIVIIGLGAFVLGQKRSTLFGMDFTGGYSLQLELEPSSDSSYRTKIEKAFYEAGLSPKEVQVRELNPSNHIKVKFGSNMEEENKPFFNMPLEDPFSVTKNPRIDWVVNTLAKQNVSISMKDLSSLAKNWSSMSGQMSDSMKKQALIGLSLALVCMMLYIAFRFEFTFAIAALLCTFHDLLITLAFVFLLSFLGLPVFFDLHTVAALMTIIGYSINDTIIIFDRIREDQILYKNLSFTQIINKAINTTLSRTILTSFTTFLVLLALICFAGPSLFGFSLVMALGVILGTLSSLFIAPLLLQIFTQKKKQLAIKK